MHLQLRKECKEDYVKVGESQVGIPQLCPPTSLAAQGVGVRLTLIHNISSHIFLFSGKAVSPFHTSRALAFDIHKPGKDISPSAIHCHIPCWRHSTDWLQGEKAKEGKEIPEGKWLLINISERDPGTHECTPSWSHWLIHHCPLWNLISSGT